MRKLSPSSKGTLKELIVAAALIKRNYKVFRNSAPSGIDLPALRGLRIFKIEVKSRST